MIIDGKSVPNSLHIVKGREGLMLLIIFLAIINQTKPITIVDREMSAVLSMSVLFFFGKIFIYIISTFP